MNQGRIRERYERFKEWQEHPHTYKLTSDEVRYCNNCGHEFTGNFCPICSQKAGMGRIGWSSVHQGIMDIWGLGTRSLLYSVWQLLLRPGHIISDYIDGKRQVSFPPVKMLFIITLIYSMLAFWFIPDVLSIAETDVQADSKTVELTNWLENHFSWTILVVSTLAIIPTWVMFRYSPRHTHHTLPEGFFIQVFFQVIAVVWAILFSPLECFNSKILSYVSVPIVMAYYVIGYKHLFGYSLWGTLWRQGFVLFCGLFTLFLVVVVAFPDLFMPKVAQADDNIRITSYILGIVFFIASPLAVLGIGHLINLIATRKFRKELKLNAGR